VFSSTTQSVSQTLQCRIVGWFVNDVLQRIWNEAFEDLEGRSKKTRILSQTLEPGNSLVQVRSYRLSQQILYDTIRIETYSLVNWMIIKYRRIDLWFERSTREQECLHTGCKNILLLLGPHLLRRCSWRWRKWGEEATVGQAGLHLLHTWGTTVRPPFRYEVCTSACCLWGETDLHGAA
jgi:hypothetical protein